MRDKSLILFGKAGIFGGGGPAGTHFQVGNNVAHPTWLPDSLLRVGTNEKPLLELISQIQTKRMIATLSTQVLYPNTNLV